MKKIGLTADSSSGLLYAPFKSSAIITKTTIHFGDKEYVDGIDITADEFYLKLEKTNLVPTTSAPLLKEILEAVNKHKENGITDVIHFPISTNLSHYGKNLVQNINPLIEDINFHVCDTKSATILQGFLVSFAEKLVDKGYSVDEVISETLKLREKMNAYFVVDDLKYLIKNGRLSGLTGTLGILAKIKPILNLSKEGFVVPFLKLRTHHKSRNKIIELIEEETRDYKKVVYFVVHTNRIDDATILEEEIKLKFKNIHDIIKTTITPTIGAHIGSKILGLGYAIIDDYDFL
ncbi:MAG: DegV family protein [Acholeplasmataceae bacterium]